MNKTFKRADPSHLEERRDIALKNAEKEAEKERFGLFTQPSPLGLGDCRYEPNHHPRDADGNVLMQPANFYTSPMKYQKTSEVYFDNSNFLNKEKHKEPYISYTKIHQRMKQRPNPQKKNADGEWIKPEPFLPAVTKWNEYDRGGKTYKGNPYPSFEANPQIQKVKNVDENGRVIISKPNVLNEPIRHGHYNSTIGHTITPYPDYMPTGYDEERHKDYEADKKWQAKYKDTQHFKSMNFGPKQLTAHDTDVLNPVPPGPPKKVWKYKSSFTPTDPFIPSRPMKRGQTEGTFDKFKRLMHDPKAIHKAVRQPPVENAKDSFKPSAYGV